MLRDQFENGRYTPDIVFGISNGGLMVADLLGRLVFRGIPVCSLWANRWLRDKRAVDQACYYFDNTVNVAALRELKKGQDADGEPLSVLLVDDLVSTTNTVVQAEVFIKRELGESAEVLFAPLYCRSTDYLDAIGHILPTSFRGGVFGLNVDEYYRGLRTSRGCFPYRKALGSE